jgi:glucose-6-phosphate isomerase
MVDLYSLDCNDFVSFRQSGSSITQSLFLKFQNHIAEGKHPIIDAVFDDTPLGTIKTYIQTLPNTIETVVILGTGGSSLGARAIASWIGYHHNPLLNNLNINFIAHDNLDDLTFQTFLKRVDLTSTHFLIISKSGGTLETNAQFQALIECFKEKNKSELIQKNLTIITELHQNKNNLHKIANTYDITVLPHSTTIGGRYSVLTMTGLLPAYMIGFDCNQLLSGAKSVVNAVKNATHYTQALPCLGAASLIYAEQEHGKTTHIFAGYGDRFYEFATWIRQLWAESLGKNGKGGLFVPSIGPLDQHSQLQLYYGGPNDKTYSFIECRNHKTPQLGFNFDNSSAFNYLNTKTMQNVVDASCAGTIESLRSVSRPVRSFVIDDYTPSALGALMMHFIVETIFSSYILDVNPYDQPAVEDSKKRTQAILRAEK